MTVDLERRRFTVSDYHLMGKVGILHEDDRVELIYGEILDMTPIGIRHASVVARLAILFGEVVASKRAVPWPQNPLRLDDASEPQPDFVLLKWLSDVYGSRRPEVEDVLLLVEVADTSLDYDQQIKLPLYAGAGISEVWIVDLNARTISVHREPAASGYQWQRTSVPGEMIAPQQLPDVSLKVADILI